MATDQSMSRIKLTLAATLMVAGLAGFYFLSGQLMILRVLCVVGGLVAAALVAWPTAPGQRFIEFVREARDEFRKVVWPTRQEALQSTLVVLVFVVIISIVLWIMDKIASWLFVTLLLGK